MVGQRVWAKFVVLCVCSSMYSHSRKVITYLKQMSTNWIEKFDTSERLLNVVLSAGELRSRSTDYI